MTRLDTNFFDYSILIIYFALVVAIGILARRAIATSEDFLLSGRSFLGLGKAQSTEAARAKLDRHRPANDAPLIRSKATVTAAMFAAQ
jgi:hypothetical protein